MAKHTLFLEHLPPEGYQTVRITGEEAKHAIRVKRLREGASLRLVDGQGNVCLARVTAARKDLELALLERSIEPPLSPAIELCTATPKGPRLDKMVDMASQVGVATWRPLDTALGVVDPGAGKIDRMGRIVVESAKQSERAWLMQIGSPITFADTLSAQETSLVIADTSGEPYSPTGSGKIRLLIGPEGGFTAEELATAKAAGARVMNLGPVIMRIETAAIAAAAIIMHAEQPPEN